jgi:hypothetical protein
MIFFNHFWLCLREQQAVFLQTQRQLLRSNDLVFSGCLFIHTLDHATPP